MSTPILSDNGSACKNTLYQPSSAHSYTPFPTFSTAMVESTARHSDVQNELGTLLPSSSDVTWQGKLNAVDKIGRNWKFDNNQDDENSINDHQQAFESLQLKDKPLVYPTMDKVQVLQKEVMQLKHRVSQMEVEHAQSLESLKTKLQHTMDTHLELEQRLKAQLHNVLQTQQAAVDKARNVRSVLTRISKWMHQVQEAAHIERFRFQGKGVAHDFELGGTPRTEVPYQLWSKGVRFATNVAACEESPTREHEKNEEVYKEGVSPFGRGRTRAKSLPVRGTSTVGYTVPSPALKGGQMTIDGLPSVGFGVPRVEKQSARSILSYCAQVMSTSLSSVRSSSSPLSKVDSVWQVQPVERGVDEETGQCLSTPTDPQNVVLPNLSIGLF